MPEGPYFALLLFTGTAIPATNSLEWDELVRRETSSTGHEKLLGMGIGTVAEFGTELKKEAEFGTVIEFEEGVEFGESDRV